MKPNKNSNINSPQDRNSTSLFSLSPFQFVRPLNHLNIKLVFLTFIRCTQALLEVRKLGLKKMIEKARRRSRRAGSHSLTFEQKRQILNFSRWLLQKKGANSICLISSLTLLSIDEAPYEALVAPTGEGELHFFLKQDKMVFSVTQEIPPNAVSISHLPI